MAIAMARMTETRVVNIKCGERFDVYIGRGSAYGNPYVIGKHGTRAEVVAAYRKLVEGSPTRMAEVRQLRGKRLGCNWEAARLAVLMDIRDGLKQLNGLLGCHNFIAIPGILRTIKANTAPKKKPTKRKQ